MGEGSTYSHSIGRQAYQNWRLHFATEKWSVFGPLVLLSLGKFRGAWQAMNMGPENEGNWA